MEQRLLQYQEEIRLANEALRRLEESADLLAEKSRVAEEEARILSQKAAEAEKEISRLRLTAMRKDEEKVTLESKQVSKKLKLSVTTGEVYKEVPWEKSRQERQEYRLREKMVKRKHRKLYKSMMEGKKERAKEIWLLRKKRRLHDEKQAEEKKAKKKQPKSGTRLQRTTKKTKS